MRLVQSGRVGARRSLFLGALVLVAAAGGFIACGSDDPATPQPGLDAGDETSSVDSSADSSASDVDADSITDAGMNFDAPGDDVDAATREDAAKIEEGGTCPGANPCDCDNDGYQSQAGTCGGDDCDDLDPLRHPNQTYVAEPPEPGADGNWDCKDPIEKQYVTNLKCATLLGLGCPSAQGYLGDPPCGTVADYYECRSALLACNAVKIGTRRQGCK